MRPLGSAFSDAKITVTMGDGKALRAAGWTAGDRGEAKHCPQKVDLARRAS